MNRRFRGVRLGCLRFWFYRMPWGMNYKRPELNRLRDGWRLQLLSFVFMWGAA